MPRMTPCPSCHGHVQLGESECPHCGTALRTTTAPRASAVLLGLALTGCPSGEDDTSSSETMTSPTVGASSGTTDGSASADNTATVGAVDYGTADTGPLPDDNGNETTTGPVETTTSSGSGSDTSGETGSSGSSGGGTSTSG